MYTRAFVLYFVMFFGAHMKYIYSLHFFFVRRFQIMTSIDENCFIKPTAQFRLSCSIWSFEASNWQMFHVVRRDRHPCCFTRHALLLGHLSSSSLSVTKEFNSPANKAIVPSINVQLNHRWQNSIIRNNIMQDTHHTHVYSVDCTSSQLLCGCCIQPLGL